MDLFNKHVCKTGTLDSLKITDSDWKTLGEHAAQYNRVDMLSALVKEKGTVWDYAALYETACTVGSLDIVKFFEENKTKCWPMLHIWLEVLESGFFMAVENKQYFVVKYLLSLTNNTEGNSSILLHLQHAEIEHSEIFKACKEGAPAIATLYTDYGIELVEGEVEAIFKYGVETNDLSVVKFIGEQVKANKLDFNPKKMYTKILSNENPLAALILN